MSWPKWTRWISRIISPPLFVGAGSSVPEEDRQLYYFDAQFILSNAWRYLDEHNRLEGDEEAQEILTRALRDVTDALTRRTS